MNKLRRKINEMAGSERGQLLGYLFGVFIGILLLPITLPLAIFLHLWLRKQMKDYGWDKQFQSRISIVDGSVK